MIQVKNFTIMCESWGSSKVGALRKLGPFESWGTYQYGHFYQKGHLQQNETFLSTLLIKGYSILLVVKLIGRTRTIYHYILDADLLCFT